MSKILKRTFVVVLILLALLLVYGCAIEPRFILDVNEQPAAIPNLPAAWEGQRLAVVGDFQVGMWLGNSGMIENVVVELIEQQPAAVLITGDFIYKPGEDPTEEIVEIARLLQPLIDSGIPIYGVLGNHDYSEAGNYEVNERIAQQVRTGLQALGIQLLQNESIPLTSDGAPAGSQNTGEGVLHLVGIGSHRAGHADPQAALAGLPVDAPRFVLFHNPNTFQNMPAHSAPMAVAGHTHCGQATLPGFPGWSFINLFQKDQTPVDELIRVQDFGAAGNQLYINCGIGFSVLPIRINTPPEITLFELTAGGEEMNLVSPY